MHSTFYQDDEPMTDGPEAIEDDPPPRAMLLGDDDAFGDGLTGAFTHAGWDLQLVSTLDAATTRARAQWPHVAIVDISGSRPPDAEAVLRWFRFQAHIPVIVVTAPADVDLRLVALRLRVDDHAVAPAAAAELVARATAQLRRLPRPRVVGDLVVDHDGRRAIRRGRDVHLTPTETELLGLLVARPDEVVGKADLLRSLGGARTANAVEVHLSSLRRKLESIGPPLIHTVQGRGYVLRPVPLSDPGRRAELVEMRLRLARRREEAVATRERIMAEMEELTRPHRLRRTEQQPGQPSVAEDRHDEG